MSTKSAPYGTWSSPITAEAITKGSISIQDVLVDSVTGTVYHLEGRPSEGGRVVLVNTRTGTDVVGREWNVRTSVQEYGGAQALVHDGIAYFSNISDAKVYKVSAEGGGSPEAVTPDEKPFRYAGFEVHPSQSNLLVSILEDHTDDTSAATIVTTLVIIDTSTKTVYPLVTGADFYACPKISPDGKHLAWIQWSHPDMPWEGGEVHIGDLSTSSSGSVSVSNDIKVAGEKAKISALYPSWANNNTLIFTSDESGYVNPWKYDLSTSKAESVFAKPIAEDFGIPMWLLNFFPYVIVDKEGTKALWTAIKDGRNVFYVVDLVQKTAPEPAEAPYVVVNIIRGVSRLSEEVVFIGSRPDQKSSVVQCSLSSVRKGEFSILKSVSKNGPGFPQEILSPPQPVTLESAGPVYAVFYPPTNPDYKGTSIEGEKPPCVINVHGGPTGFTSQGLDWNVQYFTSRGWGWLDVNYGGSYGYGRKYIERLAGNWGLVDVQDCITAARALSASPYNLIDPKRLVIRGGSAGGFTVLASLSIVADKDLTTFAAATSSYGVSDLKKLAEFTHKFESQYLNKLIGGTWEEVPEVYKERSPVWHAERVKTPLLILQGEDDRVVPKEQAEEIYNSIHSRGGVVEYKLYPGEGHGWRREENLRDALEREIGFYEKVLELKN